MSVNYCVQKFVYTLYFMLARHGDTGCERESEKWILLDINKTIVFDCNKIHFSFRHLQRIRFICSYIHKQIIPI